MRSTVLLLAAGLASAPALSARQDVFDGKWWKRPRIAAEIGLTAEQSRRIEEIFRDARSRLIDRKADLEKKQLDLSSELDETAPDRREVERRVDAVESARAELQKARLRMILDMKEVLTREQWRRLVERRQQMRERRRRTLRERLRGQGDEAPRRRDPDR